MDFEQAILLVRLQETGVDPKNPSGYVNDPRDPGGETNWGISKRAHPDLDIKNLTWEQAKAVYKSDYWNSACCEQFPPWLRLSLLDDAVNHGALGAIKKLQVALGVKADGLVGSKTLQRAQDAIPESLLKSFAKRRLVAYAFDPNARLYFEGWAARTLDILLKSLEIA